MSFATYLDELEGPPPGYMFVHCGTPGAALCGARTAVMFTRHVTSATCGACARRWRGQLALRLVLE